ncbi:ATP-dependent DNA helicase PIF1 [Lepeophtheirus salmonis]|uniref:ATP-dependent DNA helicase PIF1 n=1 Tax=Lepeophtheirus salmonis TaxID=72036 RepID=UPI001AEA592D|nr:ATP-dependent DNA helicase PIF1-like [Lepeophtheirus salmonis]
MTSSRKELEFPRLRATVRIEKNSNSETLKDASISLQRNEFRDLILRFETNKVSRKFPISPKNITVHRKFASEGKATIKLLDLKTVALVSNAPPRQLILFLKSFSSKLVASQGVAKSRERALASLLPNSLTDISPITLTDAQNLKKSGSSLPGATPDTPKSTRRRISPLLTPEQREVISVVSSGLNLFFTGGAGTGKSFIIRKIIGSLPPETTYVTASTGVAAHQIGGTTLHSFSGIPNYSVDVHKVAAQAEKKRGAAWRKCKILIIDEISMVDGRYFETLEAVARIIRNSDKPFGGIQLVLTGDFLQLPPVNESKGKSVFCFESPVWDKCVKKVVELTTVKRQSDPGFISLLNNLRFGKCTSMITKTLIETGKKAFDTSDGICATRLCTHSADVDTINRLELKKLKNPSRIFKAIDTGSSAALSLVEKEIELKIGAQVMLTKNISVSEGLVNGARGVVTQFEDTTGNPMIKFKSCGERRVTFEKWNYKCPSSGSLQTRQQLPLRLAWAFSIHKSQGMTLDFVQVSLSKVFEAGQAYVALSRAKDFSSLRVLNFHSSCVRADPRVVRFYRNLKLMTPVPI